MTDRSRSPVATLLIVLALVAMAGGVALALRSEDPYRSGTTHDATLVQSYPDCAYWSVELGDHHYWRSTELIPTDWQIPLEGRLRIVARNDAVFEAPDGGSVTLWGGDLDSDPPIAFTMDCPISEMHR